MNRVYRGEYCFIGPRAEDSAKYYDIVISHGYDGDPLYLAWDAAHKFGQRMVGPNVASYRDGVICGERAEEAADFIDKKRAEIFASLPEQNRKKALREGMWGEYLYVEEHFGVTFKRM